jgi:arylsulfatase A-like enzyme
MMITDDLGWKDLSCYGNKDINTATSTRWPKAASSSPMHL